MSDQIMKDTKSGLETFFSNVAAAIKDASELEVLTFTGDVKKLVYQQGKNQNQNLDWGKFFTAVTDVKQAELSLVAATLVQVDGDTVLFISNAANAEAIKQAHVDATVAAQKYRTELVLGLARLLGLKITSG